MKTKGQLGQLRYQLALNRAPGIGPVGFMRLLKQFPDLAEFFNAPHQLKGLRPETLAYLRQPPWQLIDADVAWGVQPGHHILSIVAPDYPSRLQEIDAPPPLLFVQGNLAAIHTTCLAIVGSRRASANGALLARRLAHDLALNGLTIVSGLAIGIDSEAHRGTLTAGGVTLAVLGSGLANIYPKRNLRLAEEIQERGAVISEFPPDESPRAENFPRRNRILSGLSLGVVVVEAALKSGSLITARYAAEQGREVFAVPGSLLSPLSAGCHSLIHQGAKLVTGIKDILEELHCPVSPFHSQNAASSPIEGQFRLAHELQRLLESVDFEPTSIDLIIDKAQMCTEAVLQGLTELEVLGYVARSNGGYRRSSLDNN